MERTADRPQCLVHGDTHAGNLFVTPESASGLIDWQLPHRSHWSWDVSYHLTTVLTPEERERAERDLLREYLGRLAEQGVAPPSFESAWDDYRASLAYGYYLWAMTQRVDPPITEEFVRRLGTAVAYHGTFEMLGV